MAALAQTIGRDIRRDNTMASVLIDSMLVVTGALVMALLAQLSIKLPFTPVPVTGQTLGVLLIGGAYGAVRGATTMALYLAFIAAGLPFGAEGLGGAELLKLTSATGGYLFGFVIAAAAIGWLAERGWDRHPVKAIAAFVIGEIIVFGLGVTWLAQAFDMTPAAALDAGFYPFFWGDVLKVLLASAAFPTVWGLVNRDRDERPQE